jgi:taurine dioxygenase
MALGIQGREDDDGDALLEEVVAEMVARTHPYFHNWRPDEMITWDNWRMLHRVTGADPTHERRMHRTTIVGDYALGAFEDGGRAFGALRMTV